MRFYGILNPLGMFSLKAIAVMQPYFLPYIGYWKLVSHSDVFVIFDDVSYIKKGWINRNYCLVNGSKWRFVVPLLGASQNRLISELLIHDESGWRSKFLRTIHQAYSKAPYFSDVMPLLEEILVYRSDNLSNFVSNSIRAVSSYLSIAPQFILSSEIPVERENVGVDRIIQICKYLKGNCYINLPGGRLLYSVNEFELHNIKLSFVEKGAFVYSQMCVDEFVDNLSILDVIMHASPLEIHHFLGRPRSV